jgi:hypothetical protein
LVSRSSSSRSIDKLVAQVGLIKGCGEGLDRGVREREEEGLPFKKAALKALGAVLMAAALLERREILRRAYMMNPRVEGTFGLEGEGRGKRKRDGTDELAAKGCFGKPRQQRHLRSTL